MYVPIVEDDKGHKYSISPRDRIGEGATAEVWLGVPLGSTASTETGKVAIKIPHPGASRADLEKLKEEYLITQAISVKLRGLGVPEAMINVPWMREGRSGARVPWLLVMELAPTELQKEVKAEWSATATIEAVRQYLQLLTALHAAGYATYGDRKETDLRWDRERQRLIVLDWNRAGRLPDDFEARNALIAQDTHGFVQLFAAILFGESGRNAFPELDNLTLDKWKAIPRGVRATLINARNMRASSASNSCEALLREVSEYATTYAQDTAKATRDLLAEAGALTNMGSLAPPDRDRRIQRNLDLLERVAGRNDATSDDRRAGADLQANVESMLKSRDRSVELEYARARDFIVTTGDYQRGHTILSDVLYIAWSATAHIMLRVIRLRMFARLGMAVRASGQQLGSTLGQLLHMLDALDSPVEYDDSSTLATYRGQLESFSEKFQDLPNSQRSDGIAVLECFAHEVGARRGATAGALDIDAAVKHLRDLAASDSRYAYWLEACLPDLVRAGGRRHVDDSTLALLSQLRLSVIELWRRIAEAKGDLAKVELSEIESVNAQCKRLWLYGEISAEVKRIGDVCLWLLEIHREIGMLVPRRGLAAMLVWAKNPPEDLPNEAVEMAQSVLDNLQDLLCKSISERLEKSLWPDEIADLEDDAKALVLDAIAGNNRDTHVAVGFDAKTVANQLESLVADRRAHLTEVVAMLVAESPTHIHRHPLGGVEIPTGLDMSAESFAGILALAEKGKVEIFGVYGDGDKTLSVREVIQHRRLSILSKLQAEIVSDYRLATDALTSLSIEALRKQQGEIWTEIGNIEMASKARNVVTSALSRAASESVRALNTLRMVEDALDRFPFGDMAEKERAARSFLSRFHVVEGIHASERLLPDVAKRALDQASVQNPVSGPSELSNEIESLKKEVEWLESVDQAVFGLISGWASAITLRDVDGAEKARRRVFNALDSTGTDRGDRSHSVRLAIAAIAQDHRALLSAEDRRQTEAALRAQIESQDRLETALRSFMPEESSAIGQVGLESRLKPLIDGGQLESYLHLLHWFTEIQTAGTELGSAERHLIECRKPTRSSINTHVKDAYIILSNVLNNMEPSPFNFCYLSWKSVVERLRELTIEKPNIGDNLDMLLSRGEQKAERGKQITESLIESIRATH